MNKTEKYREFKADSFKHLREHRGRKKPPQLPAGKRTIQCSLKLKY